MNTNLPSRNPGFFSHWQMWLFIPPNWQGLRFRLEGLGGGRSYLTVSPGARRPAGQMGPAAFFCFPLPPPAPPQVLQRGGCGPKQKAGVGPRTNILSSSSHSPTFDSVCLALCWMPLWTSWFNRSKFSKHVQVVRGYHEQVQLGRKIDQEEESCTYNPSSCPGLLPPGREPEGGQNQGL